jgi:pyrroline-5-carboxylate reductase
MIPAILLVGCGHMGGAMLAGWQDRGLAASVVVEPVAALALEKGHGVRRVGAPEDIDVAFAPAAVVFAIKPQNAAEALPRYRRYAGRSVFLSIMAGRTLAGIRASIGVDAAIVRAMPNTPASIRQGMAVACPSPNVSPDQKALCDELLRAIGAVAWVDDESLLDPVTAVSGSGPAYVFLLAELLEQAARNQGIPAELARLLARQTVSGAGQLLAASAEDAATLRRAVTSPKGTTEAALDVLMKLWPDAMDSAIAAATVRSRELAR